MSRRKPKSSDNTLDSLNISIAKARLAKLEADLPPPAQPEYTRYEDLPPLPPEDRERLKQDFIDLLTIGEEEMKRRRNEWYEKMKHFAP